MPTQKRRWMFPEGTEPGPLLNGRVSPLNPVLILCKPRATRWLKRLDFTRQKLVRQSFAGHPKTLAYPPASTKKGLNALHIAAQDCNIQQCRKLLKQGADVNARTEDVYAIVILQGSTALHKAVQQGSQELAQLLLANRADVNAKGYNANIRWRESYLEPDTGPTALHEAAEKCDEAMVNLLLEHGANIKARTKYGKTPLHSLIQSVVCEDNADIAKLMLEHHASLCIIDHQGNTPLLLAVHRNQPKIVAVLLLTRSPNINTTDKEGRSVLHLAVVYGNKAMARLLLDHGADINADSGETMFGGTPLDEALSHRKRGIVDLLRSRGGLRRNQLQA